MSVNIQHNDKECNTTTNLVDVREKSMTNLFLDEVVKPVEARYGVNDCLTRLASRALLPYSLTLTLPRCRGCRRHGDSLLQGTQNRVPRLRAEPQRGRGRPRLTDGARSALLHCSFHHRCRLAGHYAAVSATIRKHSSSVCDTCTAYMRSVCNVPYFPACSRTDKLDSS